MENLRVIQPIRMWWNPPTFGKPVWTGDSATGRRESFGAGMRGTLGTWASPGSLGQCDSFVRPNDLRR